MTATTEGDQVSQAIRREVVSIERAIGNEMVNVQPWSRLKAATVSAFVSIPLASGFSLLLPVRTAIYWSEPSFRWASHVMMLAIVVLAVNCA